MDLGLANVSWVAVVVAAVVNMVVGYLWYSPMLLGTPWMKALGKTQEDLKNMGSASASYVGMMVGSVVSAFVLSYFVNLAGAATFVEGALVGLMAAVGFVVTSHAGSYLFEGKSKDLYFINVGYYVVSYALMGVVLVLL